ncbi:MAG: monovalent cation:proton antiporter-2 (CPA2) family protein, partial [Lautropia sp.]
MAAEAGAGGNLLPVVMLLGAAVVAVPIFKRIGLGSVLGYLAAGLAIGPFGFGWFQDPQAILHTAELGVVMFLFVIGLEMRPSHLWGLRRQIFGLGSLQCLVCGALLTVVGVLFGFSWPVSFVSAMGFVLTSTAIVMQLLGERGDLAAPRGQRIVAILLFEDLLIVPLLAVVAVLAPEVGSTGSAAAGTEGGSRWATIGLAAASLGALVAAGIWLLNPLFRVLANARAREVMTAAALLVVLGAALLMQAGGLSMAMGAFLAGVLLSESTFRHQLEADVEPFRGLLLGLFFLGVGMALDLATVGRNWPLIAAGVVALMATKAACIYVVARLAKSSHADAIDRAVLMAQGGEFAFVLFAAALAAGVIDPVVNANMTAIVVLSMAITPLVVLLHQRFAPAAVASTDGVDAPEGVTGQVLIIGFGRVGQIVSQHLLSMGARIAIIDSNPQVARDAEEFGFKVWYGDGTRMDVLHAAGAHEAVAILVCIDDAAAAT